MHIDQEDCSEADGIMTRQDASLQGVHLLIECMPAHACRISTLAVVKHLSMAKK
jgi:hypothetical protein